MNLNFAAASTWECSGPPEPSCDPAGQSSVQCASVALRRRRSGVSEKRSASSAMLPRRTQYRRDSDTAAWTRPQDANAQVHRPLHRAPARGRGAGACCPTRRACCRSFFLRFLASGSQRWQNLHITSANELGASATDARPHRRPSHRLRGQLREQRSASTGHALSLGARDRRHQHIHLGRKAPRLPDDLALKCRSIPAKRTCHLHNRTQQRCLSTPHVQRSTL